MFDYHNILKYQIQNGAFNKNDSLKRVNMFYMFDQITHDEYEDLMKTIDEVFSKKED